MNEIQKIVQPVEIDARKRIDQINNLPVLTRVDCDKATEWLKTVTVMRKDFEKVQKEKIAPHKAEIDAIKALFKKPLDLLTEAETIARDKINAYLVAERQAKEAEALKIAEQKRKEAEKELKKLDRQDAKADKYDPATARAIHETIADKKAQVLSEATKPVDINQSNDTSTVRTVWDFELVDISAVPAEYLSVNAPAIRAAIRNGAREIPGVKIYQKPVVAIK